MIHLCYDSFMIPLAGYYFLLFHWIKTQAMRRSVQIQHSLTRTTGKCQQQYIGHANFCTNVCDYLINRCHFQGRGDVTFGGGGGGGGSHFCQLTENSHAWNYIYIKDKDQHSEVWYVSSEIDTKACFRK